MAGGTGGHVYPGLAVADELKARGAEVIWLGTREGIESRLVPAAGIPVAWISISGLRGKSWLKRLLSPFRLTLAVLQAIQIFLRHRPMAVLGMGGFVAGPGGLVTWLLRKPLLVHEQNAVVGMTNRLLAPMADRVFEAFPGSFPRRYRAVSVGNPVRADIYNLDQPNIRLLNRNHKLRLLVVGGSLGANVFNRLIPDLMASIEQSVRPQLIHQTGKQHYESTLQRYKDANIEAEVKPFLDDIAVSYKWADLVICRSGALTVSEIAAAGLAAIFVPYPHAVDDHQTRNAMHLVESSAALMVADHDVSVNKLKQLIDPLIEDAATGRKRLLAMANKSRQLALPDSARQVADAFYQEAKNG